MSAPILTVQHLTKTYANGIQALKDVNFEVQPGEFLVIIGLSGSGKSTLLRCLNRLTDATSGEIRFQGQRVDLLGRSEMRQIRKKIAMIFQHFNLIPRRTVLANVLMGRLGSTPTWKSLLGLFTREDEKAAREYLRLVGIAEKAEERADQLSGGQQQRVAIARALCQTPDLLLADEPVASLDPATSHSVMNYLKKANRELGITILCNLHFLSLAREYATRVIALKSGEIVYNGPADRIDKDWFKRIYGQDAEEVQIE